MLLCGLTQKELEVDVICQSFAGRLPNGSHFNFLSKMNRKVFTSGYRGPHSLQIFAEFVQTALQLDDKNF